MSSSLTLLQDVQNNGPFMLAHYGSNLALGFKGEPDFIRRCFNWAMNTGVIRSAGQLSWYYEQDTGRLAYVCPKSMKAIKMGLFLQFQAEIILNKEIQLLVDHSRDDEWIEENKETVIPIVQHQDQKIARLAAKRVKEFMKDHVIFDSFFLKRIESVAMPYGLAAKGRADSPWE